MGDETILRLLEDVKMMAVTNRAENYKNGKEFNIFYIQQIETKEVCVCRFIRELLDPKGSHGQGEVFLKEFIKLLFYDGSIQFSESEYKNARITQEELIDGSRRIDIVIRIGKKVIPLEVKIYASDQSNQCYDYYNYAVNLDKDTKIYYLTLDGHDPSYESKGSLTEEQYQCLSFSYDILKWLEECIKLEKIEQIYSVRELLIQFRNVIRSITGNHKGDLYMQIKEKISSSSENFDAAMKIESSLMEAKIDKMCEVFGLINNYMKSKGYGNCIERYSEESDKFYRNNKKSWPSLNYIIQTKEGIVDDKIVLRFEIEERLYLGFSTWDKENNWQLSSQDKEIQGYIKENFLPKGATFVTYNNTWYWWKYLNDNNNVNFRRGDSGYSNLFDIDFFKEYMNTIYKEIDKVLNELFEK